MAIHFGNQGLRPSKRSRLGGPLGVVFDWDYRLQVNSSSMFLDEAVVEFNSGRGGSGAVGFHREKHVPRGGPNGADGGRGGDIILLADRGKRTLYDFKLQSRFKAEDGVHGVGNKSGKGGKSIEIKVPVGTVVTDDETGEVVIDLNKHGMRFILCKGGKGGLRKKIELKKITKKNKNKK